jgi:hypothetical protein
MGVSSNKQYRHRGGLPNLLRRLHTVHPSLQPEVHQNEIGIFRRGGFNRRLAGVCRGYNVKPTPPKLTCDGPQDDFFVFHEQDAPTHR